MDLIYIDIYIKSNLLLIKILILLLLFYLVKFEGPENFYKSLFIIIFFFPDI